MIFVANDAAFGNWLATTVIDPDGGQVYAQTNGNWSMGNDGDWFGTILAPDSTVSIGSGFLLAGAVFGMGISIGDGSTVQGIPAGDPPVIPAPGAIVLGAIGLVMVGLLKRPLGRWRPGKTAPVHLNDSVATTP